MADIFISYKKEDAGRVIRLVEALRAEGLSVWWDHGIQAGSEWDKSIREELYAARIVIAIWSNASVNAPWVKEEATVGKTRGVLLPVKIDEVDPPLGFTLIQAADLVGWKGDRRDQRWVFFLDAVRGSLTGETRLKTEAPLKQRKKQRSLVPWLAGGAAGLAALLLAAVFVPALMKSPPPAPLPPPASAPAQTAPAPAAQQEPQPTTPAATPPATTTPATPASAPASGPAAAPPPPAPPATPPAPPPIPPGEQALWDRATAEKSRQAFQTYLISYPNGAYAQRARDILLTCRTETNEVWKPGPDIANQMLRGVGDTTTGMTPVQACEKAKNDVRDQARLICNTIVTNGGYRNAKWTVSENTCDCKSPNPRVTVCIADLPYSCRWEMKMTERVEICG